MLRLRASFVFPGVLAALLTPMIASGQADPTLWRFVYPNAKALISIDWARIQKSPAGAMIRDKWLSPGALPAIPGFELLNDIDRVLISSPGKGSADDSADSPILIAIQGHFDAAQVRQLFARFGAKPQSYNSFQVYRPQGRNPQGNEAKDTAWVLFDAGTILFGDAPSIFSALDRSRFASPPIETGSLLARATEMDGAYQLWVIMDATEIASSDQIAALLRGGEWASEAQGFEVGVNLQAGLAADLTVRFSSDATAKRVTAELTRVMNLAAKDKASGQLQNIAKKLKFNLDGAAARISLRLTPQDLEKASEAFAAGRKAAQLATVAHAPLDNGVLPAPAKPLPASPAVIRIEGLDDGPREIPYHPDKEQ
jgi:hypothetical protein